MMEPGKNVCVKCRWHGFRVIGAGQYEHVCTNEAFTSTDYVTGERIVQKCGCFNSFGDCGKFEEKPQQPKSSKRSWFTKLMESL